MGRARGLLTWFNPLARNVGLLPTVQLGLIAISSIVVVVVVAVVSVTVVPVITVVPVSVVPVSVVSVTVSVPVTRVHDDRLDVAVLNAVAKTVVVGW